MTQQHGSQTFTLASQKIKVNVDRQTGAVTFLNSSNQVLLQEAAHGRSIAPTTVAGAAVTSAAQSFHLASDEGIYGLGQHQEGAWNYEASGSFNAMVTHRVRVGSVKEVDSELTSWLRQAYAAA